MRYFLRLITQAGAHRDLTVSLVGQVCVESKEDMG